MTNKMLGKQMDGKLQNPTETPGRASAQNAFVRGKSIRCDDRRENHSKHRANLQGRYRGGNYSENRNLHESLRSGESWQKAISRSFSGDNEVSLCNLKFVSRQRAGGGRIETGSLFAQHSENGTDMERTNATFLKRTNINSGLVIATLN